MTFRQSALWGLLALFYCLESGAATKWIDVSGVGSGAANGADVNNQCAGVGDADCIGANLPAGSTAYMCNAATGAGVTMPVAGSSGNVTNYDFRCPGGTPGAITASSGTAAWLINKAFTKTIGGTFAYSGSKPIQINASNVWVEDNVIDGGQDGITLTTPTTLSNINIAGNTITGMTRYGIQSIYSGASTQSLTDLTIDGNTITDNANSGIFLQCGVASAACTYVRPTISDNQVARNGNTGIVLQDCYDGVDTTGTCADVTTNTPSDYQDCEITGNVVTDQRAGGGIAIYGCVPSAASTYGLNVISGNTASRNMGVTGGLDLFNSTYFSVYGNVFNENKTTSIDGNGLLIDYGNRFTRVYGNTASGNAGVSGTDNSGVGIMCLKCIDIAIWGNKGKANKAGMFFAGGSFVESGIVVENNTFAESRDYGVYFDNSQDASSTTLTNNAFDGPGTCIYVEASGNVNTENYNALACATRRNYNSVGWSDGANSITSALDVDGDLKPRNTSPLIRAGKCTLATGCTRLDFRGYRGRVKPDIGAYQRSE